MREVAHVALGSNIGDRDRALAIARAALGALPRSRVIAATPVEETAPIGPPGQGPYLNQMVAIETELSPHELLDALQQIERRAGRTREVRWGARVIDLDIVTFGTRQIVDDLLVVPHPALSSREFWQRELAFLRETVP